MAQADPTGGMAAIASPAASTDPTPDGAQDPASGDPASGDPASGDPASGDPASGVEGQQPRRIPGPSIRPALVVVSIAVFLVLVFGIGAALTSNPAPRAPRPTSVKGTSLVAEPATATLRPVEILGTPPSDILDALVLPKGVHRLSATPWSGATQFDASMTFRLAASQAALVEFFRTELRARGWSILSVGAAHGEKGATEVLAQRASTDGWFWEAGAVVYATSFSTATSNVDVTRFEFELYEVPDAT